MSTEKLSRITKVRARRDGETVVVDVDGDASSGGWTRVALVGKVDGDTLALDLVGQPPGGMAMMMMTPASASFRTKAPGVRRVVVHAQSNSKEATV